MASTDDLTHLLHGCPLDLDGVARVVHETVRAYARAHTDARMPAWANAPKWMKQSTREAIIFRLTNPDAPPSAQHDQWMAEKKSAGWRRGAVKDGVKKTHPLLVAYEKLPDAERRKDALVAAVIQAVVTPLGDPALAG